MSDMRRSCNLTGLRSPSYCWSVAHAGDAVAHAMEEAHLRTAGLHARSGTVSRMGAARLAGGLAFSAARSRIRALNAKSSTMEDLTRSGCPKCGQQVGG